LKAADAAIRAHSVTAGRWHELKMAYDAAEDSYRSLEAEIEAKTVEARKFGRIRRVWRDVRKHAEVNDRITELGDALQLPQDASLLLSKALDDEAHTRTRLNALNEGIRRLCCARLRRWISLQPAAEPDERSCLRSRRRDAAH
jgi:hypothetical protein